MRIDTRTVLAAIAEMAAGILIGGLAAYIGGIVAASLVHPNEGFGDIVAALGTAALVYILVAPTVIVVVGRYGFRMRGSFWLTLISVIAGALIVLAVVSITRIVEFTGGLQGLFVTVPAILGALVFTWSANRKKVNS
jgi:hypothetical protein